MGARNHGEWARRSGITQNTHIEALIRFAEAEFAGPSVNGPSLLATLDRLSVEEVFSTATFEGYSVQEVVSHLAFCKHVVAQAVLGEAVGPYPYPEGVEGFAPLPEPGPQAWTELLVYLKSVHGQAMQAVAVVGAGGGPATIRRWNFASLDAVIWLCSHDTYHLAQIRSMGVASLKEAKLG